MPQPQAERVLLYRLGSLGDQLVALPCYRLAQRAFPQAERRLLTNIPIGGKAAAAEAVLGGSGLVDGFFTYSVGERGPLALLRLVLRIRRWRPDALIYLAGARGIKAARRDRLFFRLCGIRRQIGLPLTEDLQQNRDAGTRNGVPWFEHEGERLARCLAELGDAGLDDPGNWTPALTAVERSSAAELLRPLQDAPFFAFSLGTKVQANRWSQETTSGRQDTTPDRWCELLRALADEHPGYALVILGAGDEAAVSETVAEAWRSAPGAGPALNLCGRPAPRVSAAILERARLFLGHDSGPAHLAASVGTPVLGIYSARMKPGTWVPHGLHVRVVLHWVECGGCQLDTCIVERKRCILSISVAEALTAAREHLLQTAAPADKPASVPAGTANE